MKTKGLDPGRLKKRVTIKRYQEVEDEEGNAVETLLPLKTVWAEIRAKRGDEQAEYYKTLNTETYKVTMRYTDVTEKDVLDYNGHQFQILSIVDPLEEHYYLELLCIDYIDHKVPEVSELTGGDEDG